MGVLQLYVKYLIFFQSSSKQMFANLDMFKSTMSLFLENFESSQGPLRFFLTSEKTFYEPTESSLSFLALCDFFSLNSFFFCDLSQGKHF